MTDTEKLLTKILAVVTRIADRVAPEQADKPKTVPGATVGSVTTRSTDEGRRVIAVNDGHASDDLPSQLSDEQRAAMAGRGRQTGRRRDTKPFRSEAA